LSTCVSPLTVAEDEGAVVVVVEPVVVVVVEPVVVVVVEPVVVVVVEAVVEVVVEGLAETGAARARQALTASTKAPANRRGR
jgi:hypothetical protein